MCVRELLLNFHLLLLFVLLLPLGAPAALVLLLPLGAAVARRC